MPGVGVGGCLSVLICVGSCRQGLSGGGAGVGHEATSDPLLPHVIPMAVVNGGTAL